jgi:hypothetical protein
MMFLPNKANSRDAKGRKGCKGKETAGCVPFGCGISECSLTLSKHPPAYRYRGKLDREFDRAPEQFRIAHYARVYVGPALRGEPEAVQYAARLLEESRPQPKYREVKKMFLPNKANSWARREERVSKGKETAGCVSLGWRWHNGLLGQPACLLSPVHSAQGANARMPQQSRPPRRAPSYDIKNVASTQNALRSDGRYIFAKQSQFLQHT